MDNVDTNIIFYEDLILYKMKPLYSKNFWNWHHQNYLVVDWQHICYVW